MGAKTVREDSERSGPMNESAPPDVRYAFYAILVTQIFTFLGLVVSLAKQWLDNQSIREQNDRQLRKQDITIAKQAELHEELNGAKALAIAAATAAGVDRGKLLGKAEEQNRVAIKVAAADASAERLETIKGGGQIDD